MDNNHGKKTFNRDQGTNRQQGNNRPPQGGGRPGGGYSQSPALEKITAPYNFVPLSKKVFFPDWAKNVSHDVPFKDGISGELVCELVTDTPVYVRNGGKWEHDNIMKDPEAQSFLYVKQGDRRNFMIPGTTLKGMLRNVIEIASFGKMSRVDDHRYSVRDLKNRELYLNKMKNVQAAWLKKSASGKGWVLTPCEYALVSHEMLGNESIKSAQKSLSKYKHWGWGKLDTTFQYKIGTIANRVTALNGGKPGRLVFTGQPTANRGGKFDKKNEFVFFPSKDAKQIDVPPELQKDICFIYTNPNTGKPYDEWAHWSEVLDKGGSVPVFYQMEGTSLGSFGFTRMYRLPYKQTVRDAIEHIDKETGKDHFSTECDLAETIFGFVDGNRDALKGRVSISEARASYFEPHNTALQVVLGSPKPTFYPNYMNQLSASTDGKVSGEYKSFMDSNATINGWKRYPTRLLKDVEKRLEPGTDNVATKLIPLKEGARFGFSIKIHNLKPAELGALAWALTWGDNTKLRHSLGMGKSLGFGVAGIKVMSACLKSNSAEPVDWSGAMQAFTRLMDEEVGGGWLQTSQLEQLLGMANPELIPQCGKLQHMSLASKDFTNVKGSAKPPMPKLALMPHVKQTAIKDSERFKNLKPVTDNNQQLKQETAAGKSCDSKPASLSAIEGLSAKWGKPGRSR